MRQWRVDLQRLRGDALLLLRLHVLQGAHVVQTIRQFDDDDPHVAGHGDQQLPQVLGLLVLQMILGAFAELTDLGFALDNPPHDRAELEFNISKGDAGVLDGVVQQSR